MLRPVGFFATPWTRACQAPLSKGYFLSTCGSDSKKSACNAGDLGLIPELGRSPGEENGNPPQYSLPGESHGQRSLAGYSPWGHKELEIIERLTVSLLST